MITGLDAVGYAVAFYIVAKVIKGFFKKTSVIESITDSCIKAAEKLDNEMDREDIEALKNANERVKDIRDSLNKVRVTTMNR
jgi:hypothetical protein